MRYKIDIPVKEQPVTLISGITFAQVPYWFPFYNYKDLKMDILAPSGSSGQGKRPLFVWICGGGFATMERSAYIPWLTYFAKRGYIAASVEYRLSNSAHFPAQIEDVKKAIRFLRAHADEYGIDPDRVAVGGESAGGNLASMVGVTNDIAAFDVGEYPEQSSHVSAVVNFYGPAVLVKEPGSRCPIRQDIPAQSSFWASILKQNRKGRQKRQRSIILMKIRYPFSWPTGRAIRWLIFPEAMSFIRYFLKTMCVWSITAFRVPRIWAWNFIRMRCPKEFWSFLTKLCDRSGFTAAVFSLL